MPTCFEPVNRRDRTKASPVSHAQCGTGNIRTRAVAKPHAVFSDPPLAEVTFTEKPVAPGSLGCC